MEFTLAPFEVEIGWPSVPDVSISNLFMFNIDLLWFLIPMSIFRPIIERRLLRRVPLEVEKNLSRLTSQWTRVINAAIERVQKDAIGRSGTRSRRWVRCSGRGVRRGGQFGTISRNWRTTPPV
jgi:hypothetical protein